MRLLRLIAISAALWLASSQILAPARAVEETVLTAPFEWTQVCYKVPPGMPTCHDDAASARFGVLAVGGSRVLSLPVDMDPLWGPHISRMALGAYFVPSAAGTLEVQALVDVVTKTDGSYLCVGFKGLGSCSPASSMPVQATTSVTASFTHGVISAEHVRLEVWLEKQYAGLATATVRELKVVFTPHQTEQIP